MSFFIQKMYSRLKKYLLYIWQAQDYITNMQKSVYKLTRKRTNRPLEKWAEDINSKFTDEDITANKSMVNSFIRIQGH